MIRLMLEPMPRLAYKTCKGCGKSSAEVGPLSWTRLCTDCALERYESNHVQLVVRDGPYYDHWRRRSYMAARRILLDDGPRRT